jgi:hypothetical protein
MLSTITAMTQSQSFAWVVLIAGLLVVLGSALRAGPGAFWGDMVGEDHDD